MPANSNVNVSQLYETGNKKFFAASKNPDGSFGDKEYHEGNRKSSYYKIAI